MFDALTADEIDELAAVLYQHFQERIEEPDSHHIVALCADFCDINAYTQKVFRDGVQKVLRRYDRMRQAAPSEKAL